MNGVEALAGELAEQERRSQLATPKAMLDDQANFLLLRAFIQEASNRSIVAGVQATLLLDLAAELCRDCSSSGADAAATDATLAAQTERSAQLDSAAAAAAAAVQLQAPAIPVTASQQLQQQQQARAARKQRFTREQQAAILESVERFYAACPSRYTELVIKHMQERFPGIEISNACVRKIKFRANEAAKQNSEVNRRESQAAADAAHGLANPERYTHCVIRDMKEKYPDLELNMGQIRKIKFRTLGNINPRQASAKPEQQQQQQQQGDP
ncbi:hypothetical protein OEZ85_005718 [Tetradesmus obliquus]|uniref:Homeobox domain-containing protein n=1 Tax=Tetradesmus obliquus TaxID=3088 RepID=A0ABY8UEC0_TETOB|nr:hypothetical protein OEZ85_005718 [Tetradesmus obliquus]